MEPIVPASSSGSVVRLRTPVRAAAAPASGAVRHRYWRRRQRYLPFSAGCLLAMGVLMVLASSSHSPESDRSFAPGAGGDGRRLSSSGCGGGWTPLRDINITAKGSVTAVGFLVILYTFVGLAIVCDEYFEPSLCVISEKLNLTPDVAGATFLAAGSSAPELFTALGDSFGPENSIGMGTIVGSAMFNILVIVALSSAVAGGTLAIDWRPVCRDVSFYCASIILLAIIFWDGAVAYYEALIMVLLYFVYVVFMKFNARVLAKCGTEAPCGRGGSRVHAEQDQTAAKEAAAKLAEVAGVAQAQTVAAQPSAEEGTTPSVNGDAGRSGSTNKVLLDPLPGSPKTSAAGEIVVDAGKADDDDDDEGGVFDWPDGARARMWYIVVFPYNVFLTITIPNCEEDRWEKWYFATFFMSILWIGALCYLMVACATEVGAVLGINPILMGILVLSIGTSVPDAIGSMIAARKGEADMAIANAIGSNVFDILLGLGLPWMLRSLTDDKDIKVDRSGILTSVCILFGTVLLFLAVLIGSRWTMNKRLGWCLFGLYIIYVLYNLIKVAVDDDSGCGASAPSAAPAPSPANETAAV